MNSRSVLCNHFLTAKLRKVETEEPTPWLFAEYMEVTNLLVKQFGRNAKSMTSRRTTLVNFALGYETGLIERPVRYGPEFVKPDKSVLRKHKAKKPAKMFEADELQALIDGVLVVGESGPEQVKPDRGWQSREAGRRPTVRLVPGALHRHRCQPVPRMARELGG
jgi:hypothetical protein